MYDKHMKFFSNIIIRDIKFKSQESTNIILA